MLVVVEVLVYSSYHSGSLLRVLTEIYLVMLHLPEKTVLETPHPLLHAVAPLLHGLAHHAPDKVPLEDLCRLPGSHAQVGAVVEFLRDDFHC